MRGGYLYVPAYDKKGIYKINVANTADVTLLAFGRKTVRHVSSVSV
mgnify:CR=1 FL=1